MAAEPPNREGQTGMKITILCAGKFKEAYWEAAAAEYQKRLTRYCSLQVIAVADEATPEHASEKEEQKIREKEGERMIAWLDKNAQGPGSRVIALAIKGKRMDSIGFASYIEAAQNEGCMQLIFIIGGSLCCPQESGYAAVLFGIHISTPADAGHPAGADLSGLPDHLQAALP